ncbi:hypothetical protein [Nonomuraea cavernae]|uniref:Uncharacterized protein n=1 Tax=Nonomuraea cavernae TaxID=2045107 RepID=A0A917Z6P5_9ACTN|nr:hypothetical protein [Nonomuraea cavernae]MCA2188666.1 hypothetical protein [Nonomuraea cavernae]GGO74351.1 hypothetical protein GCM10012289_46790 [Nonomuraea cavernae]
MAEERSGRLAAIRSKLDLLKRVEAEHGFGVIIEEPRELEPVPGLPAGVTEVFGLFHRLGGDYFRFQQPPELAGRQAWADRHIDPHCPLGNPLHIGCERYGAPEDIECGSGIYLDLQGGDVYFCDGDDYVFAYEHVDVEEVETTELASDIVTFFDFHVLGEGYPQLVASVIGGHAVNRRKRRRRHRDSWMRLLEMGGLASAETWEKVAGQDADGTSAAEGHASRQGTPSLSP